MLRKRRGRPLFLIDIAVPRDIDPAIDSLDGVYVYDMDALQMIAAEARKRRADQIRKCDVIIQRFIEDNSELYGNTQQGNPAASPTETQSTQTASADDPSPLPNT